MHNGKVIFGRAAFFAAVLLVVSAGCATTGSTVSRTDTGGSGQYSRQNLQSMYVDFLTSEGYVPSIDSDGDVNFKVEGTNFYIIVNEEDLGFFQIYQIFGLPTAEQQQNAVAASNYANRSTKVAKTNISSDGKSLIINGEIFVSNPEYFKLVFRRLISAMQRARENFNSQT